MPEAVTLSNPAKNPAGEPRDEDRLAAIEARQQRLLADLDRLNERVEEALLSFGGGRTEAAG